MDRKIADPEAAAGLVRRPAEAATQVRPLLGELGMRLKPRLPRQAAVIALARVRRARLPGSVLSLLTTPLIYAQAVPLMVLDLFVTAYQRVCFPIYGIEPVRRGRYFVLDRHRLPYLNLVGKMNCTYCSYANGVIAYVREVTARTEAYWCPIKHGRHVPDPHGLYESFADYGDARDYRRVESAPRRTLRHLRRAPLGRRPQ